MSHAGRPPEPATEAHEAAEGACTDPVRAMPVWRRGAGAPVEDIVAVERPLLVRLHGHPFAVIMRTPGTDRDLVLGFLFTEGVLQGIEDVAAVSHAADEADVCLIPERGVVVADAIGSRRQVVMHAACGMCGRRTPDALLLDASPLAGAWRVRESTVAGLPEALRSAQPGFACSGGTHGAGLFDLDGRLLEAAEDVGRHNAVDKLIGRMLARRGVPLDRALLAVSGRTSYEIVQKAWRAGIALVVAVSAPSSLAVELADAAGITLLGFARDGGYNLYTHASRIAQDA